MTANADEITLAGVSKSYGHIRAVRDVDLTIGAGQTVAILGPNGAGKTTTIDMILGLNRPDAGSVAVFGVSPEDAVRAGMVGGVLQTGSLPAYLSVRELLELVASLYPDPLPVGAVLAAAGLAELAGRPTRALSGGQSQRVRFALALIANARLLVLDEPTTGLDAGSRHQFWDAMRGSARRGTTVLFATHYLEEADAFADRVVLMAQGRIVADGPATEIRARVRTSTIRATLPQVEADSLGLLPGVVSAERHGDSVELVCDDSDAVLRALLSRYPAMRDIEVRRAALEDVFLELTRDDAAEAAGVAGPVPGGAR